MSLLDVLHFGRSPPANNCVRFLLSRFHGGILWLDKLYPLTERVMQQTTGLPTQGEHPTKSLKAKDVDAQHLYGWYNTHRGSKGAKIELINNKLIRFATQLLASKCRKDECPFGVILMAERCVVGVRMAWT